MMKGFPRFTPDTRNANPALVDPFTTTADRKKSESPYDPVACLGSSKNNGLSQSQGTTRLERFDENLEVIAVELTLPGVSCGLILIFWGSLKTRTPDPLTKSSLSDHTASTHPDLSRTRSNRR